MSPLASPSPTTIPARSGRAVTAVSQGAATGSSTAGLNRLVSNMPTTMQSWPPRWLRRPPTTRSTTSSPTAWCRIFRTESSTPRRGRCSPSFPRRSCTQKRWATRARAPRPRADRRRTVEHGSPAAAAVPIGGLAATPVLAGMASSSAVGGLSVPAGWAEGAAPDARQLSAGRLRLDRTGRGERGDDERGGRHARGRLGRSRRLRLQHAPLRGQADGDAEIRSHLNKYDARPHT